jgi:hypothetical protein
MPVAKMTVTEAVTEVNSATGHDNDQQTTTTQITAEIRKEYMRVRRWLSGFLPSLYQVTGAAATISGNSGATLAKPDTFERLLRLERDHTQGLWLPLRVRPGLYASAGQVRDITGSYRLTYVARPVDGYTELDVPEGCEDLIIMPVCAWVAARHNDDPSYYLDKVNNPATGLRAELRRDLARRYGQHSRPGLVDGSGLSPFSFYEEGDHFVIV